MTKEDTNKLDFIRRLKGKKNGGELESWCLRDIPDKDGNIIGQIAYGFKDGHTWRTSAVVEVHDTDGPHKILETRHTFYTLAGDEASEEVRKVLYCQVYG